jgi:DNA-binding NtrC family response regulator/tetratricopeptide (TPR) repeat protein
MESFTAHQTIEDLVFAGHFVEAGKQLLADTGRESDDPILLRVLDSEVQLELGHLVEARQAAEKISRMTVVEGNLLARAHRVIGRCCFHTGEIDISRAHLATAREFCAREHDIVELARIELTRFTLFSGIEPLQNEALAFPGLRRLVARSAHPHLMVELRLCVARCEARRNSLVEAKKHLNAATRLVDGYPNLWLRGVLLLDFSNLEALLGDIETSLQYAKQALDCAEQSGHERTRLAAAVNLSHLLSSKGRVDEAKYYLDQVLVAPAANIHLRLAALDSLANQLINRGEYDRCRVVFEQADTITKDNTGERLHWDTLSEIFSIARLAQAEGEWNKASASLGKGCELADHFGDRLWARRMHLVRAKCLARLGATTEALLELRKGVNGEIRQPQELAEYYCAISAIGGQSLERTFDYAKRAARIAFAISDATLKKDVTLGLSMDFQDTPLPSPDLDTAVAIIELAGHTHILAREALAVIDAARCARGAAIIASAPSGPRVIDRRGWDEPAALAVARKPASCEVIPLGEHRGEPWLLIVYSKPELEHRCSLIAIRKLIAMALTLDRYRRDEQQRSALWPAEALDGDPESIWTSEQSSEVLAVARRIAPTPLSLLVTGETGTGKEMLARVIHRASDRSDRPMVPFNCTAVPRDMIESQLFGYRRGAFTGADASFAGVIRSAAGGTLFLDEIADVPLDVQPKLLRFLETHEIHPLGETQPVKVDVRVIAATNARLEQLVADGRFREDLFYRLNVVRLKLPPLRERREEIPPLVEHYLRKYSDEQKKGRLTLADETLEYLLLYSWPGNLRQLANEVRRMVAMAEADSALTPALLSPEIQASRRTIPATVSQEPEVRVRIDQPLPAAVELLEQTMVKSALDKTHGRVEEAARILGISRKGLFLKRRRWGLGVQHH